LKLKKLDELDAELDASDRGTMIHEILEKFTRGYPETLPPDAEARLLAIGREVFSNDNGDPRVRAFWEAGFASIAAWFVDRDRKRRENGVHGIAAEAKGKHNIDGLTLTGRADRIENLEDGGLLIIDYKTGAVPKKEDVRAGIEPQLQLLAWIAASGGFEGIDASMPVACEYWALKGGASGCKAYEFANELPDLISRAEAGLKKLIDAFSDPSTPYEATPKPRLQSRHDDYAHLSRMAEWGKNGEDT
jgi:ATP-dependent helicase/nuclease subunit B